MDPVDLPALTQLRERWRMLAIAAHACGMPDLWTSTADSDTHADPIGSGLELAVRPQGAVLTGFDWEAPEELWFVDPGLLTDGAPGWVRTAVEEVAPLGDALWWEGAGWYRSSTAPDYARAVDILTSALTSPDGMADELLTLVEADQYHDRAAALEYAMTAAPEALIRLYGEGRRYGFEPDHAYAAVEVYAR